MIQPVDLSTYDTLSFDCYGTLIDWESGIVAALAPVLEHNGRQIGSADLLAVFAANESTIQRDAPRDLYSAILGRVHSALAAHFGLSTTPELDESFGGSVGDWPAFPDSADSLLRLATRYRLVILSNVDRESFAGSALRLGVEFDAVYTAHEIGSYKPDPANFRYLLSREHGPILHVAQSLYHDHVPAQQAGMKTAWIDRQAGGGGATPPAPDATYDARFESMADFATAAGV